MEKPWTCQRDGACCTQPKAVVMTHAERDELKRAAPNVALVFDPHEDGRFVSLQAGPCPLYLDHACSVYEVRPFNCRRFGCFRHDVSEPFIQSVVPARLLTDRPARRQAFLMQRKAQPWALAHGWEDAS